MICPKCNSEEYIKAGIINKRQRYKCNRCAYHYTVVQKSDVKSQEVRRLALQMYLEGMGFRAIGRVLNISYGTVFKWIKHWETQIELPKRSEQIQIVELDELHTYVGSKKTTDGYGLLLIDMESGLSLLSVETDQPIPE